MKDEKLNYNRMLILCKMFIKETNNLKLLMNNFYEDYNQISESMYYITQYQNEIMELLLKNFDLENLDCQSSFYHFMKYKKCK